MQLVFRVFLVQVQLFLQFQKELFVHEDQVQAVKDFLKCCKNEGE